jgi:hypothetical protein
MIRQRACSQGEFHRGRHDSLAASLPVEENGVEWSDALDPLDWPGVAFVRSVLFLEQ